MSRSPKRPDLETIYYVGAQIRLFQPEKPPAKPVQKMLGLLATWPDLPLRGPLERQLRSNPLDACYDHDIPCSSTQAAAFTISLEEELSTGFRAGQAAQVWRVSTASLDKPLVARLYDPLYFHTFIIDRFAAIERAVGVYDETYKHFQLIVGSHVPILHGIFAAEITVNFIKPRHIYCVLSDYVPGIDMQCLLDKHDPKRNNTCPAHKAAFVDCTATLAYDFFICDIIPMDMLPRNLIIDIPTTPSSETFCDAQECPWRNRIHIDLDFPSTQPEHPYALEAKMIDIGLVRFMKRFPAMEDIKFCRQWVLGQWNVPWIGPETRDLLGRWESPAQVPGNISRA
ncbi:hypothetical protein R3P38DRAFT_2788929 [Favolaschia claudopus]|uniref:Protein kinase domain-containing protein n=1 Tax=Favolaschia claudopus TaxID=2862362 RepID=A0AAW0AKN8_9AGAR